MDTATLQEWVQVHFCYESTGYPGMVERTTFIRAVTDAMAEQKL